MDNTELLKLIVNRVFDEWTCKKAKPSQMMLSCVHDDESKASELICVLSTNPYTSDTQAMDVQFDESGAKSLCIYGMHSRDLVTRSFKCHVQKVIYDIFGLSSDEDENCYGDYTYTAIYGRQFIGFIESLKNEIIDMCKDVNFKKRDNKHAYVPYSTSGYPLNWYTKGDCKMDPEWWFNESILMKSAGYDESTDTFKCVEHEFDGDKLVIECYDYDRYCSDPFNNPVEALTALIWDKLNPSYVKYTEIFGDLPEYSHDNDLCYRDLVDYIRKNCTDLDMLFKACEFGLNMYKNTVADNIRKESRCACFEEIIKKLKANASDIEDAVRIIDYWDSSYQICITEGIRDLLEY